MSKKMILFFIVVIFFSYFGLAQAEIIINEVQLNPTSERFIELYNSNNSLISLTDWYIQRKTATGTFGSMVTKTDLEGKTIGPNSYFLISRASLVGADIILTDLTLTESNTIQIKNSEGNVVDKVGWGSTNDCNNPCVSNPTDGQSIQKTSNGWIVALPTPKATNEIIISESAPDGGSSGGGSTSSSSSDYSTESITETQTTETPTIKTKITAKNISFVDLPLDFKATALGYSGEELYYGKYFWNFGDGSFTEIINNGSTSHTYLYPGDYVVSMEYYLNPYSQFSDAVNKFKVKVVPLEIFISKIGDISDFYIELANTSSYDIDISSWQLSSTDKTFIFPRNSNILAKNKLTLSSQITGFKSEDRNDLKLISLQGKIISRFDENSTTAVKTLEVKIGEKIGEKIKNSSENIKIIEQISEEEKIPVQNLTSSTINADIITKELSSSYISYISYIILFIFLSVGGGIVYFIRRKRVISQNADDFEILDE